MPSLPERALRPIGEETHTLLMHRIWTSITFVAAFALPCQAELSSLKTKLKPETVAEFETYVHQVEGQLQQRWNSRDSYFQINDDPRAYDKVMNGDLWVKPELQPNPRSISDGLIHDWYGAVFIPNTTLARVLAVLQDFDHHSAIYPNISRSRLVKRDGNDVTGYWRLEEKGQMVPAVFDVTLTAHYQKIAADKWVSLAHADDIQAVENAKALPVGEGMGLMWKLYSYWTLQQVGSGVFAECRSLSLSRGLPGGLGWIIRPFLNSIPRESMDSTLKNTRKASGE